MYKEYLDSYKKEVTAAIEGIDPAGFEKIIETLIAAYRADKQIIIMGNGGSAGTANHFVCDFGKNAVQDLTKRRFRILSVCDNVEKITAIGNDIAFEEIFRQQLINLLNPGDVVIAVSASGNSPNLVRACDYAAEKGAHVIALAGFAGGKISEYAEAGLIVPLTSYEQIEDVHLVIMHMIVCFFKNHPECLG